ncbi:HalOD1 output domain-containing protein [Natronoarchaeum philippinense]|nr:HalOD1 output domain-containing protein [Natronoarchaeum philippinense]
MTLPPLRDETATQTSTADGTQSAAATADEHRLQHDFQDEQRLSTSVVRAVAAALETDPLALDEQLHDAIDPDALDRLLGGDPNNGSGCRLSFEFAGCAVTIRGDGQIIARPNA